MFCTLWKNGKNIPYYTSDHLKIISLVYSYVKTL
jgi:hypothetical protein